jgi:hypothetical protein
MRIFYIYNCFRKYCEFLFFFFQNKQKEQIFLQTFATKGYQVMLGLNENKVIKYLFGCRPVKRRFHVGFTSVARSAWKPLDQWEHSF